MKKLTEWVEKSFVNKTIFVLAIIFVLITVFVLIPKGVKIIQKQDLINSGVVFVAREGTRYHLYDDCSNMNDPHETTESKAIDRNLERCSKCYAGVMDYYGGSHYIFLWILLILALFIPAIFIFRKYKKKATKSISHEDFDGSKEKKNTFDYSGCEDSNDDRHIGDKKSNADSSINEQNSDVKIKSNDSFTEMSTKTLKKLIKTIRKQCSLSPENEQYKNDLSKALLVLGSRYADELNGEVFDLANAIYLFKQSISYNPQSIDAKLALEKASHKSNRGRIRAAALVDSLKIRQNPSKEIIASAMENITKFCKELNLSNDEEDIKLYQLFQSQYAVYANQLGLIYWNENDTKTAIFHLAKAVSADQNNKVICDNYGKLVCSIALQDIQNTSHPALIETSISFLRFAAEHCPSNKSINNALTNLLINLSIDYEKGYFVESNITKAIQLINEALLISPDHPTLLYALERLTNITT